MKDPDICDSSSVEHRLDWSSKDAMNPDVQHAGFASHICGLPKGHPNQCVCACGAYWIGKYGQVDANT